MQIKNPTKEKIEGVQIGENSYSIDAEGTLKNVPEADARYWQENLHKFLILRKDELEEVKEDVVEVPKPTVETVETPVVEDEVKEEVKEEAPVVAEKPKKTKKVK